MDHSLHIYQHDRILRLSRHFCIASDTKIDKPVSHFVGQVSLNHQTLSNLSSHLEQEMDNLGVEIDFSLGRQPLSRLLVNQRGSSEARIN